MSTVSEQTPASLPESNLSATLTYAEWCTVLGAIAGAPYRDVCRIIERLMTQLGPQADAQQLKATLAMAPTASEARN